MKRDLIIQEINNLLQESDELLKTKWNAGFINSRDCVDYATFHNWFAKIKTLLSAILPTENEFRSKIFSFKENYYSDVKSIANILKSILDYESKGMITFLSSVKDVKNIDLVAIFKNFHKIVRQLRCRYDNRTTLDVNDEYDVQDLLHGLLLLIYDDVRREEWTPSYAGKSARQDFLIKKEKIVIETKKARKGLTEKELGDELIIDIARYKSHPDCKQLICFIYDPEGRIANPIGFIGDIENANDGFVKVYINP